MTGVDEHGRCKGQSASPAHFGEALNFILSDQAADTPVREV